MLEFKRKPAGRQAVAFSSFLRREKRNLSWRFSKQALRGVGARSHTVRRCVREHVPRLRPVLGVRGRGIEGGRGRGKGSGEGGGKIKPEAL